MWTKRTNILYSAHWLFRQSLRLAGRWRYTRRRGLQLRRYGQALWGQLASHLFGKAFFLVDIESYPRMKIRPGSMMDLTAVFGRPGEERIMEAVQQLPDGATFVDIGAHIGRYTLIAAKAVGGSGQVLAMEPHSENYRLLADNVALNEWQDRVKLYNTAIGTSEGTVVLRCAADTSTASIVESWLRVLQIDQGSVFEEVVSMQRLEQLLRNEGIQHVDLLKIDVEGAELQVLEGATGYLRNHQIGTVICEVHEPVVRYSQVESFLSQMGYRVATCGSGQLRAETSSESRSTAGPPRR